MTVRSVLHRDAYALNRRRRFAPWLGWFAVLLALAMGPARALNYSVEYDPDAHNRFLSGTFPHGASGAPPPTVAPVENPASWAAQYDFSGVGWATGRSFRHVAMISPTHYVNATHAPLTGHTFTFVNRLGEVHTFATTGAQTQISGDLSIGTLTTLSGEPVDVTDYDIAYYPLFSSDHTTYAGQVLLRYGAEGKSQWESDPGNPDQGPRLAMSMVTSTSAATIFASAGSVPQVDQVHAATPVTGDSGSPVFHVHEGELTLVGTTHTTSGVAYLGSDIPALNAYMANDGYALTVLDPPAGDGTASIARPGDLEEVIGTVDITGTATDDDFDHYEIEYYAGLLQWQLVHSSSVPVVDGVLMSDFDTTVLGEGSATIRLRVFDSTGAITEKSRSFAAGVAPTYDPAVHNRFAVGTFAHGGPGDPPPTVAPLENATAWTAPFDLSGVGWPSEASYRHVALITGAHYINSSGSPLAGQTINFVDRTGGLHTLLAQSETAIHGPLAVGTLTTLAGDPVDATALNIATYPLYSANHAFYRDRIILRHGGEGLSWWTDDPSSATQGPRSTLGKAWWSNVNRLWLQGDGLGLPSSDTALDLNFPNGDQGAPMFYAHDGQLTIVGVATFGTSGWFLASNLSALDAHLALTGHALTVLDGAADGTVDVTHPAANAAMEGTIDIIGTAMDDDFDHYEVEYYAGRMQWVLAHTSTTPVVDDVLMSNFDTTLLETGNAAIRVRVFDSTGAEVSMNRWFTANLPPPDLDPTGTDTGGVGETGTTADIDDQDPTAGGSVGSGTGPDIDDRDDAGNGTSTTGTGDDDGPYDPTDNGRDSSNPTTSGGGTETGDPNGRDSSTPPTTSGGSTDGGDPFGREDPPIDADPTGGTTTGAGASSTGDIDDQDPTGGGSVGSGTGPDLDDRDDAGNGSSTTAGVGDDGPHDPTDNGRDTSFVGTSSAGTDGTGDPDGRDTSLPGTSSAGGDGTGDPNGRDSAAPVDRDPSDRSDGGPAASDAQGAAGGCRSAGDPAAWAMLGVVALVGRRRRRGGA